MGYTHPKFMIIEFNCPVCDVFSHQYWCHYRWSKGFFNEKLKEITGMERSLLRVHNKTKFDVLSTSLCRSCNKSSIWINEKMIYP